MRHKFPKFNIPTIMNRRNEPIERYYIASSRYNLGYAIMDEMTDGVLKRQEIFYHTDPEVIIVAMQDLLKDKFDVKKYAQVGQLKPMIIKFEEKHGDSFYIYTSRQEFFKIFFSVFEDRYNEGWYDCEAKKPKKEIDMTIEEINALTDEKLKKFQLERYKTYQHELKEYNEFMAEKELMQKAIEKKDGALALNILENRRSGEYENFETIEPNRFEDEEV